MKEMIEQIYSVLAHLALLHDDPKLDEKVGKLKDTIDNFSETDLVAAEQKFLRKKS